ncbi:aldo/keto reductase [Micrococcaceae bacterium Sec5.7]
MQRIAAARGVSMAQVAMAWVLKKPVVSAPIVGATKPHHLTDAVAALEVQLTDEEFNRSKSPTCRARPPGSDRPLERQKRTAALSRKITATAAGLAASAAAGPAPVRQPGSGGPRRCTPPAPPNPAPQTALIQGHSSLRRLGTRSRHRPHHAGAAHLRFSPCEIEVGLGSGLVIAGICRALQTI